MFLVTIEVNTFLVENRRIVDIGKFVGLNSICHDAFANLGLLAIHSKIQPFQNLLKDVGDVLKRIFITTEDTLLITIANYLVVWESFTIFLVFFCLRQ